MRRRAEILSSIFRQGGTGYLQPGQALVEADKVPRYVYQLRTGLAYQSHWFAMGGGRLSIYSRLGTLLVLKRSCHFAPEGPSPLQVQSNIWP
jgi:hypothetical protein